MSYAQYQDFWLNGVCVRPGVRECAARYDVIRAFCGQYTRPFTVLDVGAGLGYFSTRLAEDFPECTAVAIEKRPEIGLALAANGNPRVLWLARKMRLDDLQALADVEHIDVILALSVLHHIDAEPADTLAALRALGDHLLLEVPVEADACSPERVQAIQVPDGSAVIGYGQSHLARDAWRPIIHLAQPKATLRRRYLGDERPRPVALEITSDFSAKTVRYLERAETRAWHRGINLQTFLRFGGTYPHRDTIAEQVRAAWDGSPHGDLRPFNVVLQGDRAVLIDGHDPATHGPPDDEAMASLLEAIQCG